MPHSRLRLIPTLGPLLLLVACGQPPRHEADVSSSSSSTPPAHAMPAGTELPPGHPTAPAGATQEVEKFSFAGRILLQGDYATRDAGHVFISVRPLGGGPPTLSKKYDISGIEAVDGVRTLEFTLTEKDNMFGAPLPYKTEVHAMFSATPFVDSKEAEAAAPAEVDSTDVEVVLAPAGGN
jgi:hypothetical protein